MMSNNNNTKGLMWRLLRKNVSVAQFAGFSLANLIGLSIVIIAIQFYVDVKPFFSEEDNFFHKEYMTVTKKVKAMGSLLGAKAQFSDEEITELCDQEWCSDVGCFTTSNFGVYMSLDMGRGMRPFSTAMFFESLPDEFIDVDSREWHFDANNPQIPIIISKDYLSLYNFGFAAAQGMPQLSESMMMAMPMTFTLYGQGHQMQMPGHIIGFSNRLNTVVVPDSFMRWANEYFASSEPQQPVCRLMVEVHRLGDPKINEYMQKHSYEVAGDKADSGKANYFLNVISSIVVAVGVLISVLAFYVLLLSIHLLLQKNNKKLQDLLHLGYSVKDVCLPYIRMVLGINLCVMIGAIIVMLVARSLYMPMIAAFSISSGSVVYSIATACTLMSLITLGNVISILRRVKSLWYIH